MEIDFFLSQATRKENGAIFKANKILKDGSVSNTVQKTRI